MFSRETELDFEVPYVVDVVEHGYSERKEDVYSLLKAYLQNNENVRLTSTVLKDKIGTDRLPLIRYYDSLYKLQYEEPSSLEEMLKEASRSINIEDVIKKIYKKLKERTEHNSQELEEKLTLLGKKLLT